MLQETTTTKAQTKQQSLMENALTVASQDKEQWNAGVNQDQEIITITIIITTTIIIIKEALLPQLKEWLLLLNNLQ